MREGWDTVQKVWIKDVEEATTICSLLYLMKQLRVYIGRQKSKPGKLASIFSAVPLRITRSQGAKVSSESVEISGESSEEMEENSDGEVQPRAVQRRARQARPAGDHKEGEGKAVVMGKTTTRSGRTRMGMVL
eukprot:749157-Hanusia_phi.AAC.1